MAHYAEILIDRDTGRMELRVKKGVVLETRDFVPENEWQVRASLRASARLRGYDVQLTSIQGGWE